MYLFASAAPKSALITLMTLRFVPLFQRRLRRIALIQGARGVSVREGSLRSRMSDGMTLLKTLLTWSLEEALQTADSMKARGYGISRRTSYAVYRLDRRDIRVLAGLGAGGLGTLWGWFQGYGMLMLYPRMKPPVFTWQEAAMYAAFCLFAALPSGWKERRNGYGDTPRTGAVLPLSRGRKAFTGRDIVHNKEGEFVVLCGPSGSGKTTLLRHLKRELTPVGAAAVRFITEAQSCRCCRRRPRPGKSAWSSRIRRRRS